MAKATKQQIARRNKIYYWENIKYREKKKKKMREYIMEKRIKEGSFGSPQSILKILFKGAKW